MSGWHCGGISGSFAARRCRWRWRPAGSGRFCSKVLHAERSRSTTARCLNPALAMPRASPPAPLKSSTLFIHPFPGIVLVLLRAFPPGLFHTPKLPALANLPFSNGRCSLGPVCDSRSILEPKTRALTLVNGPTYSGDADARSSHGQKALCAVSEKPDPVYPASWNRAICI